MSKHAHHPTRPEGREKFVMDTDRRLLLARVLAMRGSETKDTDLLSTVQQLAHPYATADDIVGDLAWLAEGGMISLSAKITGRGRDLATGGTGPWREPSP